MDLNTEVKKLLQNNKQHTAITAEVLRQLISVIDLTSLNPSDDKKTIKKLCLKANSAKGKVAGVCVYPEFVSYVKKELGGEQIRIVSVANFPTGQETLQKTLGNLTYAIEQGAQEIDIVFPYTLYLAGERRQALAFIETCKRRCGPILLKVILEISEFKELEVIYSLSKELIASGADFLKTSTGKSKHGATLEASSVVLLAIKSDQGATVGFKASGGIQTIEQAMSYIYLAKDIMGEEWVTPKHFRLGASTLLDHILSADEFNI